MIDYTTFTLRNGLTFYVHRDADTPMAAFNICYNVGSRDEDPKRTGFAHLFEHLMFGGSANVPDFDAPLQMAGGESNAFTNNDITNYYELLPAQNLETAFWLESDRMRALNIDPEVLDTQRKVVVEEFKETCLTQPYGDVWHHLSALCYERHPYRWPTIGLVPEHVEEAQLEDVRSFFREHYNPANAIVVVAGNVTEAQVRDLAERHFADIPAGNRYDRQLPTEPAQTAPRRREVYGNAPLPALYLAFPMSDRTSPEYYATDLLSDLLGNGPSSRLYRRLLKERRLFSTIDCYVSGSFEAGLLVIEGKPSDGITLEVCEQAIWEELEELIEAPVDAEELEKVINKAESTLIFSESSVLNKAINLAGFAILGMPDRVNEEVDSYRRQTPDSVHAAARKILNRDRSNTLYYRPAEA